MDLVWYRSSFKIESATLIREKCGALKNKMKEMEKIISGMSQRIESLEAVVRDRTKTEEKAKTREKAMGPEESVNYSSKKVQIKNGK